MTCVASAPTGFVLAFCLLAVSGCVGRQGPTSSGVSTTPATYDGPLADLVPTDVREVLALQPRALLGSPATAPLVEVVAPQRWRRALGDRTGVFAEDVEELVVCRWDTGEWWALARVPRAPDIVRATEPRMVPVEVSADEPFVRRVGYLVDERYELVALGPELLLVAKGRGAVVARLLQALQQPGGEHIEPPWARNLEAPLALALPHPLALPLDTSVGLLLAQQRALRVDIEPLEQALRVTVRIEAELPDGAEANFRALLEALAASELGRALGLPEALPTLEIQRREAGLDLRATFDPSMLARGIHLLFRAEIADIVEDPASPAPDGAEARPVSGASSI